MKTDRLRWLSGEESIRTWLKDTGFRSDFCRKCGSPVPNLLRDQPFYWVPAGLLEGDGGLKVATHLYMGSKAPWESEPTSGNQHQEMPSLELLIKELGEGPGA